MSTNRVYAFQQMISPRASGNPFFIDRVYEKLHYDLSKALMSELLKSTAPIVVHYRQVQNAHQICPDPGAMGGMYAGPCVFAQVELTISDVETIPPYAAPYRGHEMYILPKITHWWDRPLAWLKAKWREA